MLRHFDRSMITNPRYQKFALDLAKEVLKLNENNEKDDVLFLQDISKLWQSLTLYFRHSNPN